MGLERVKHKCEKLLQAGTSKVDVCLNTRR